MNYPSIPAHHTRAELEPRDESPDDRLASYFDSQTTPQQRAIDIQKIGAWVDDRLVEHDFETGKDKPADAENIFLPSFQRLELEPGDNPQDKYHIVGGEITKAEALLILQAHEEVSLAVTA